MIIGSHISTKGNLVKMIQSVIDLDMNTFQYFTRNPRGGSARKLYDEEIAEYKRILNHSNIKAVVAHLPYTVNLASSTKRTRNFGKKTLYEDIRRANIVQSDCLVMHPGSHVKNSLDDGIKYIVEGISFALDTYKGDTKLCLETMSGKGTEIGRSLDEIRLILEGLDWPEEVGICLDSCHLFASGYDFRNKMEVTRLINDLESKIGLERVLLTHLNDSKESFASNKDRHENIGKGLIGIDGIRNYLKNSLISKLPIVLETPVKDESEYLKEIELIKSLF